MCSEPQVKKIDVYKGHSTTETNVIFSLRHVKIRRILLKRQVLSRSTAEADVTAKAAITPDVITALVFPRCGCCRRPRFRV